VAGQFPITRLHGQVNFPRDKLISRRLDLHQKQKTWKFLSVFMAHTASPLSIARLVLGSTLFTLGITLLRLAGELRGWPSPWFDKSSGVVGITWFLPPIFGFYFAWKLWREGERIDRVNRAFALALLGVVLNQVVEATIFEYAHISIYSMLVILWTCQGNTWCSPYRLKTVLIRGRRDAQAGQWTDREAFSEWLNSEQAFAKIRDTPDFRSLVE
jgi:hypothetical protein